MSDLFETIKGASQRKILELSQELKASFPEGLLNDRLCVYACGSLGRLEMTEKSDLDLFFIIGDSEGDNVVSNIDKYTFFSKLYQINVNNGFEPPSKGGLYWEFIEKEKLLDIGSRLEDYNNSFTARMLLLLESKPLYNDAFYSEILNDTISKYFSDFTERKCDFYPMFLINDILRYWYTLTLNYEYRRDSSDDANKKYWKRLKLKYARLITCYSMIACLYKTHISPEYVLDCVHLTPFERIETLSQENSSLKTVVSKIKKEYEWFLDLRNQGPAWWDDDQNKTNAMRHADTFHNLVIHQFMKSISELNPALYARMDTY